MSTFQFDTSGVVRVLMLPGSHKFRGGSVSIPEGAGQFSMDHEWSDLTPFTQGYLTAIAREAWESLDQIQKDRLDHFGPIAFSDFSPELVGRALRDCEAMASEIRTDLTSEDGRRIWEHRQASFPGFNALDDRLRAKFSPLRLVIAEDGLLHAEEPR